MDNTLSYRIARLLVKAAKLVEEPGYMKDWGTPEGFLEKLYEFGSVRLDPCSNPTSLVESKERWTKNKRYLPDGSTEKKTPEDTFTTPWPKKGLVFVNPPYGKESDEFFEKMAEEGRNGVEIIALVPARVDTVRWHTYAEEADAVLFWRGRISFVNPETKKPQSGTKFPSAVLYWGKNVQKFADVFGDVGSLRLKPKEGMVKKPVLEEKSEDEEQDSE